MDSPISTWTGTQTGERADNDTFFHVFEVDKVASKFNSAGDLLQNETVYLLIQHDPTIKIDKIVPSCGTMQRVGSPVPITRPQSEDTVFYDNTPYNLKYRPVTGSLDGFWWFTPPTGTPFNGSGSPPKTISGREIIVDIDQFGRPCPCRIEYNALFKQVQWAPPFTNFADNSVTWDVAFQVFYSKV